MSIGNGRLAPLLTPDGGSAIPLINKTGAASVKGTVVDASITTDLAVAIEDIGDIDPIGVIYQSGIPDGDPVLVIISGVAEILIDDATAATSGDWAGTSDVTAGRAQANTEPPATVKHDQEIGHFVESKSSGTDVLAKAILHFR